MDVVLRVVWSLVVVRDKLELRVERQPRRTYIGTQLRRLDVHRCADR